MHTKIWFLTLLTWGQFMLRIKHFIAMSALALTSACGGGGSSGGGGGGTSGNRAPTFTTSASLATTEQRTDVSPAAMPNLIAQLAASDPDGNPVTFAIASGKDGGLFHFRDGVNGALAFIRPPSFETPEDANRDNVYEVDVTASDGTATTTRTFLVTLNNSTEGLILERLATGLPGNAVLVFDRVSTGLSAISRQGDVFDVNLSTGAVTARGRIPNLPAGTEVLDAVPTEIAGSGYSLALRNGQTIGMRTVRRDDLSAVIAELPGITFTAATQPITAALWVGGGEPYLALGDGGIPDAAQDPANLLGNVTEMRFFAAPPGQTIQLTPRVTAWGFRSPILVDASNRQQSIDRGPTFNEFNVEAFFLPANNNFEWPIRDGLTAVGFSGAVTGNRVGPQYVAQIGTNGVGRWIDALAGLQPFGWQDVTLFSDDQGNIFSYSFVAGASPRFERRNLDFTPNAGTINSIVAMTSNSATLGNQIYLLDSDGELFIGRISA